MDSWLNIPIPPEHITLIASIDEFKGRWEALGNLAPDRLRTMKQVATIESVGSSTRIEGAKLTDIEINQLLRGLDIRAFRSRDEEEVAGYAQVMELIFESWTEMPFSENLILQLHGALLQYSQKDERHRGRYKTIPNNVAAFDPKGRNIGTVFETASPFDTPRLMAELVTRTRDSLAAGNHHRLLIIAVFVVRFLAIHPFQDGNGRLSRALTTLLLLQSGYSYVPYSSFERVIEDNKDGYYQALRWAQSSLNRDESSLVEWLGFFLRAMERQKEVLNRRIREEKRTSPLPPLTEKLLRISQEHGQVTVKDAVAITGANRNTIKEHLRQLVLRGSLKRNGKGRGSWYTQD